MSMRKTWFAVLGIVVCCPGAIADDVLEELSGHLGKTPALVVACAESKAELATVVQLAEKSPWMILCCTTASEMTQDVRRWAGRHDLLGKRLYVIDDPVPSLWLADGMADAVWIAPGVADPPSQTEVLRVLRPGGVCIASGKVAVKPAAEGVDQWRHPYHAPDNNVVSRDRVAQLPGELRFQTHPVFAPMPNQALFAGGRIFFFSGHIAFHRREEPLLNTLTVLNAYNGLRLWKRQLAPDCVVHNVAKLATDDEVVFAEGPTLRMLDAATGEERGKFNVPPEAAAAGDTDWKWIAQEGDVLFAAFGPPDARVAPHRQRGQMGHWPWNIANEHYRGLVENFGTARRLAAYRYPDMKLLWSVAEPQPFDARALCMHSRRIFQLAPGMYMAARDTTDGKVLWRRTPEKSKKLFDAIGIAMKRQAGVSAGPPTISPGPIATWSVSPGRRFATRSA